MDMHRCLEKTLVVDINQTKEEFIDVYIKVFRYCFYGYDVKTSDTIAMTIMLTVLSIVGVVGNAIVLRVYIPHKNKPPTTMFIITLACHDLLLTGILVPYQIIITHVLVQPGAMWFCGILEWFNDTLLIGSVYILSEIAIDRYFAVCHPLKFFMNQRRAKIMILVTVIWSGLTAIPGSMSEGGYYNVPFNNETLYFYVGDYKAGSDLTIIQAIGKRVMDVYLFLFYVLLSFIVIFCYANIFIVVCKRVKKKTVKKFICSPGSESCSSGNTASTGASGTTDQNEVKISTVVMEIDKESVDTKPKKKKTQKEPSSKEQRLAMHLAKVLSVVSIVFILTWIPYFGIRLGAFPDSKTLSVTFFFSNALNPILYCFTNRQFRQELKKLFASNSDTMVCVTRTILIDCVCAPDEGE